MLNIMDTYVESLGAYAVSQFLGNAHKPDVDSIEGLSPAIAICIKTTSHTLVPLFGQVPLEIYDYF